MYPSVSPMSVFHCSSPFVFTANTRLPQLHRINSDNYKHTTCRISCSTKSNCDTIILHTCMCSELIYNHQLTIICQIIQPVLIFVTSSLTHSPVVCISFLTNSRSTRIHPWLTVTFITKYFLTRFNIQSKY